jgi:hypothetical protein
VGTVLPIGTVTAIRRDGVEVEFKGNRIVASFHSIEQVVKDMNND